MIKDCFFEAHYYSSGLKFLPFGDRPSWIPAADTIIISQDTGISIQEGDYVLGLARLIHNGEFIFWVGLSEKSIDQVYGDRGGNYHGIGLWLKDSLVLNPEDLADIIQKLLDYRSSVQDWKSMGGAVEKALNHIKLAPRSDLLPEFKEGKNGVSFGQGSFGKVALWHVQVDSYDLEFHIQVGSLISLFQLINHKFADCSRLFAVVSKNHEAAYGAVKFADTLKPSTYELNEEKVQMILELVRKSSASRTRSNLNEIIVNEKIENIAQDIDVKRQKSSEVFDVDPEALSSAKIEVFRADLSKINNNTVRTALNLKSLEKRTFIYFLILSILMISVLVINYFSHVSFNGVARDEKAGAKEMDVSGGNDKTASNAPSSPIIPETPAFLSNGKYYLKCSDPIPQLEVFGDKLAFNSAKFSKWRDGEVETWESNGKTIEISPLLENKIKVEVQDDKQDIDNKELLTLVRCPG